MTKTVLKLAAVLALLAAVNFYLDYRDVGRSRDLAMAQMGNNNAVPALTQMDRRARLAETALCYASVIGVAAFLFRRP